jgi:TFIIF-interacting CTD phosphatase-like protein
MEKHTSKPLLILDLDETLIHGSETQLERSADFRVGPFHIYKRPFLDQFLKSVSHLFDLAIWSSASATYVEGIALNLLPFVVEWKFVWSRARCVSRFNHETFDTDFIKDLRKVKRLGFELDRTLIIDDTPIKVSRNYGNAIYIKPFEGSIDDQELVILWRYLESLSGVTNFRSLEKRGWRIPFLRETN